MVLPLKNFVKIKALDTPDKILNFYGLPLKNPLVLSWSGGVCVCVCVCVCVGGGGRGGKDIKFDSPISCKYHSDFLILLVCMFSLLGTSLQMQLPLVTPSC